jgi:hypothetical protein
VIESTSDFDVVLHGGGERTAVRVAANQLLQRTAATRRDCAAYLSLGVKDHGLARRT